MAAFSFPDLSEVSLTVLSKNDAELTSLIKSFSSLTPANQENTAAKKVVTPGRFRSPLSDIQVSNAATPFVPKNTQRQTQWAVKVFTQWANHRNSLVTSESEKVPERFLDRYDCVTSVPLLNRWLTRFVLEGTVKQDGSHYTSETVYQLLSGLHRHMVTKFSEFVPNFMAKKNKQFAELNAATDRYYRSLQQLGVGSSKKHAEPFTAEEEEQMWESGVLGSNDPKALLNAVFYLNGRNFALRDCEQFNLNNLPG